MLRTYIKIKSWFDTFGRKSYLSLERYATCCLLILGITILAGGLARFSEAGVGGETFTDPAYNDSMVRGAVGNLFALIEGAFGALIMVVAGLGAIVAASMGAYRAAVGMLVVAVGAFILRALVSLFFGEDFKAVGVSPK